MVLAKYYLLPNKYAQLNDSSPNPRNIRKKLEVLSRPKDAKGFQRIPKSLADQAVSKDFKGF